VEEWGEGGGEHDLVAARALAPQPIALEYAAPLLRVGGRLIDWRGRRDPREEAGSLRAADELGLELAEIRHVIPFEGALDHHLHVYLKVRDTPARFPRRPGIARKRPLSG
jgi:16S rRNA (guanine527-N7)-methyltransferase